MAAIAEPKSAIVAGSGTCAVSAVIVPVKRPLSINVSWVMKAVVDVGSRPALVSIPRIRNLSTPPAPEASEKQVRFVPKGLISTRKRLGLSAAELAKLLEVSAQTIYNWERGATKPSAVQRAKLVSLRGIGKRQLQAHLAEQEAR